MEGGRGEDDDDQWPGTGVCKSTMKGKSRKQAGRDLQAPPPGAFLECAWKTLPAGTPRLQCGLGGERGACCLQGCPAPCRVQLSALLPVLWPFAAQRKPSGKGALESQTDRAGCSTVPCPYIVPRYLLDAFPVPLRGLGGVGRGKHAICSSRAAQRYIAQRLFCSFRFLCVHTLLLGHLAAGWRLAR